MIDPIGPSLLRSGTSLIFSGTSLSQSGARRQPVFMAQPGSLVVTGRLPVRRQCRPPGLDENHIRHFHIFIRNTDISLRSCSRIANMFEGVFSLLHQIPNPDGGARMNPGPASPDPDPDLDQALAGRDEAWEAWLASRERYEDDEPLELEDEGDYHDDPDELAEIIAEARQAATDQAAAEEIGRAH